LAQCVAGVTERLILRATVCLRLL